MSTSDAVLDALDDVARSLTRLTAVLREERQREAERTPVPRAPAPPRAAPERARWMKVGEAVNYTGRCRSLVLRALRDGSLVGSQQAGERGHWRVHTSAVDAWMGGYEAPPVPIPRVARGG